MRCQLAACLGCNACESLVLDQRYFVVHVLSFGEESLVIFPYSVTGMVSTRPTRTQLQERTFPVVIYDLTCLCDACCDGVALADAVIAVVVWGVFSPCVAFFKCLFISIVRASKLSLVSYIIIIVVA